MASEWRKLTLLPNLMEAVNEKKISAGQENNLANMVLMGFCLRPFVYDVKMFFSRFRCQQTRRIFSSLQKLLISRNVETTFTELQTFHFRRCFSALFFTRHGQDGNMRRVKNFLELQLAKFK